MGLLVLFPGLFASIEPLRARGGNEDARAAAAASRAGDRSRKRTGSRASRGGEPLLMEAITLELTAAFDSKVRFITRFAFPSSQEFTLVPNRREDTDSATLDSKGDKFSNMRVLPLAESAGCSNSVSFESRKGTWEAFFPSARNTPLRADKDVLICFASVSA